MKKIFYYAPIVLTVILTGCASNRQQIAENASGDGMLAKAAVPIPSRVYWIEPFCWEIFNQ